LLADFPLNIDSPHGGVEVVARNLALGLSGREDSEVHVITSRADVTRPFSACYAKNLSVHYVPRPTRHELATLSFRLSRQLRGVLRTVNPDVVHVHDLGRYPLACASSGYPYALTVHGISSVESRLVGPASTRLAIRLTLQRAVEWVSFRCAAIVIANSNYIMRQVPRNVRVARTLIPNPVDPLFLLPHEQEPQPDRIVWIGRLNRLKAVEVLLSALAIVRRDRPLAHLRLVGPEEDPTYVMELHRHARAARVADAVQWVGLQRGEQLRDEYAAATVVALPSRQENVPMSIAEAMAVGRPVVASDVGGVSELVLDSVTGFLCPPTNVERLAQMLMRVLADETLRKQMGSAARRTAEASFELSAIAAKHVEVYRLMNQARSFHNTPTIAAQAHDPIEIC
jgi:glycosyltransferase involved in cell wall biosynthesis